MFSKVSVISLAVLGLLSVVSANDTTTTTTATATVTVTAPAATTTVLSQCNTGSAQCCNTVTDSQNQAVSELAGLLGLVLGSVEGLIGVNCSPITAIGLGGGAQCDQQPVCCTNVQFNGLINLGCNALTL